MSREVLVAHDSPAQAEALALVLEGAGYHARFADDGERALSLYAARRFDLVLSDVTMPGLDGFELCRRIKEDDEAPPVMLFTSLHDPLDVVRALDAGADGFLRKPVDEEHLLARLDAMLASREHVAHPAGGPVERAFGDERFVVRAERQQLLDMLVSTFEDLVDSNHELQARERERARTHRELADQLRLTEYEYQRLKTVLSAAPQPLVIADARLVVVEVNAAAERLLQARAVDLTGRALTRTLRLTRVDGTVIDESQLPFANAMRHSRAVELGAGFDVSIATDEGDRLPVHVRAAPVLDAEGRSSALVVVVHEIGDLALHDPSTGLPGRQLFANRARQALEWADDRSGVAALFIVGFPRLEPMVQALAPEAATMLMDRLGARFRRLCSHPDVVLRWESASPGRLDGADFGLVVAGARSEPDVIRMAELLVDVMKEPFDIADLEMVVSPAVGVATGRHRLEAVSMIDSAIRASRTAARRGAGGYEMAASTTAQALGTRLQLEADLSRGLAAGELELHYQPIVSLLSGRVIGLEALTRWRHPERGLIAPAEFIPMAEESGLIRPLGEWAVREACRQLEAWGDELADVDVAVNVSVQQLSTPAFADRVKEVLGETGMDPRRLVLEITESAIVSDDALVAGLLRDLVASGVRVAIDDFGTGHSSLRYLRQFPVDTVKIDRSFVTAIDQEANDAAIVAGMVRLAHALGMTVVAEGVESEEQAFRLRMMGCDQGQGFLWSRGLPGAEIPAFMDAHVVPAVTTRADSLVTEGGEGALEEVQDDALAYLAHELRGPTTALSGFVELLKDGLGPSVDAQTLRTMDAMEKTAHSLSNVLDAMGDARAVHRGALDIDRRPMDVSAVVTGVVRELRPLLRSHDIVEDVSPGIVCEVDDARLSQALRNLLSNARKFSPSGTTITVSVHHVDGACAISVQDQGTGVPDDRRHLLFRKFARLNPTGGGMGIGLFLSHAIARAHGGDIRYEPGPQGGSVFTIVIPC